MGKAVSTATERTGPLARCRRVLKPGWVESASLAEELLAVDALRQALDVSRCHAGLCEMLFPCVHRADDAGHPAVLGVTRFDRQLHASGAWILRLPQEDFCQALRVPSSMKYEADGGPGVEALAQILAGAIDPRKDLRTLLCAQLLFWMRAAIDGHAKNFSLRLHAGNRYELTPLYDVLSAWPLVQGGFAPQGLKLKMAVLDFGVVWPRVRGGAQVGQVLFQQGLHRVGLRQIPPRLASSSASMAWRVSSGRISVTSACFRIFGLHTETLFKSRTWSSSMAAAGQWWKRTCGIRPI